MLFVTKGAARMTGDKPGVAVASNEGIRIDLDGLLHAGDANASDPPVEPGDLINVAPAGNVQVDNEFGQSTVAVGLPVGLCVPSLVTITASP